MASVKDQDHPYGTVSTSGSTATFSDSQTGILANTNIIRIAGKPYVISALSATGLTCTLSPTPTANLINAGFDYSGRHSSPLG